MPTSVRDDKGDWRLLKSCYRKLRLSTAWVAAEMASAGLTITEQRAGRLFMMAAVNGGKI